MPSASPVSRGWADVRSHLAPMSPSMRCQVTMWVTGPLWIPQPMELEAMRTYLRGQVRTPHAKVSANAVSGEISAAR